MKQKSSRFTYILAAMIFCFGCGSNSKIEAQYSGEKSRVSPEVFENIDYKVKSFSEKPPSEWHKTQFQTIWTRTYSVKRRTSVKEQAKTFPRYDVVEEIYETEDSAKQRLERIQEKPPNLPIEQQEYWIVTGFQYQKNVYFIQTDSSLFSYYMSDFADKLAKEIKKL
jgi:hypothetical protein